MADEPTNDNVEEVVPDQSQPPTEVEPPQVEETPAEQAPPEVSEEALQEGEPEEQPETEAAQEEDAEEVPEKPLSRRAQTRFDKLEAMRNAGRDRFQQLQREAPSQPNTLDYSQVLDADPEVIQQFQADRQKVQELSYAEGLKRADFIEFKTNIRLDLPLVSEKLSKLDPQDAERLDADYLEYVGFDPRTQTVKHPDIGYADYMDARLEQSERLAASMNAQTVKNIAKQSAQTGLRPDGSSAKRLNLNQAPEDMNLDELYAKIGQVRPKKQL